MQFATLLSFSLILTSSLSAQLKNSAVPKECNTFEGSSWHFKPYNDSNMHFMHHFGAAHMPIVKGKAIFGVSFRHEGRFAAAYVKKSLNWEIFMGGTTNANTAMSTTFAKNYNVKAAPRVSVFKGTINIPAATVGPTTGLGGPVLMVRLKRPYIYPGGNFLIEIVAKDSTGKNLTGTYNVDRIFGGGATTTLASFLGDSCPTGKNGLTITTINVKPGGSLVTRLTNASVATGSGLMILGTSIEKYGPLKLPFDLKVLGASGCMLWTDILLTFPAAIANSTATTTVPIPQLKSLEGLTLNTQFMILDKAANKFGLAFSGLGQRVVSKAGSYPLDSSYMYWTGAGDPYKQLSAPTNWTNRADVMVIQHN